MNMWNWLKILVQYLSDYARKGNAFIGCIMDCFGKCYLLVHYFVICGECVNSDNVFWCCISFSGYIRVSKTSVHTQKQTICYTEYILLCKIHCSNTRRRERQRDGRNRKLWSEHPTEMAMKKQAHKQENV